MNNSFLNKYTSTLELHEFSSMEEAKLAATDMATNTYGQVIVVTLFEQGGRVCASSALPLPMAAKVLNTEPARNKGSLDDVNNALNRPIDEKHVKAVSDYIQSAINEGSKYIIPSLTVNSLKKQHMYTCQESCGSLRVAYMVIHWDATYLSVTDGQHRLSAIQRAFQSLEGDAREKLKSDSIAIMFSFETARRQIHQDFADCSKTKALPKSMIAVYDRRVPANGLVLELIEKTPLFSDGRTDSTSKSLSKKSNCFVLTSNIRGAVKSLLTGQHSMADSAFDSFANKALDTKEKYNGCIEKCAETINWITEYSPVIKDISQLPHGPQRQKVVAYRERYLIANPLGLNLICKMVNRYEMLGHTDTEQFIARVVGELDWEKSAHIWRGNVILEKDGKYSISGSNKSVDKAVVAAGIALAIDLQVQNKLL